MGLTDRPQQSVTDRRRLPRTPVVQPAELRVAGRPDVACEIRDYHQNGFFLRLPGDGDTDTINGREGLLGKTVEVRFRRAGNDLGHRFRLAGRVVRVADAGVGVALTEPPPSDAWAALDELARRARAVRRPGLETSTGHADLEQACRAALAECITASLCAFSKDIEAALLDAASVARSGVEQTGYFDACARLRDPTPVGQTLRRLALAQAEHYTLVKPERPEASTPFQLSLVDQEAFEDWLNLLTETTKLEASYRPSLRRLERRLSRLANTEIHEENNPYGPAALGQAFRQAVKPLGLSHSAYKIIYASFARALDQALGRLYASLEELTATLASPDDEALICTIEPDRPERRTRGRPGSAERVPAPPEGSPRGAAPSRSAGPRANAGLASAFAALNQLSNALIGSAACGTEQETGAPGDDRHRRSADQPEVACLLGSVLERLSSETAMPEDLRTLVQQWQVPLAELAARDPGLLNDQGNPARRLIDQLGAVALAADDRDRSGEQLRKYLREWTPRLTAEESTDPAVLAEAAAALHRLTDPWLRARDLRLERLREVSEGKQRIDKARRAADREIGRRIGGRSVPRAVTELLDSGWRQWLILTHLRTGSESLPWREGLSVVDRLLAWLNPEAPLPDPGDAFALIDFVAEHLTLVCPELSVRRRLLDSLALLLTDGSADGPRRHQAWTLARAASDATAREVTRTAHQRLKGLRVGDWLRVPVTPEGPAQPLRLTWIAEDGSLFVFADARGKKQLELAPSDLIAHLESGRAVAVESLELPLTERTVAELLHELQHQAKHDPVTGLFNRRGFLDRVSHTQQAGSQAGQALCLIELDQFKVINSLCGMDAADAFLRDIAAVLAPELRRGELAGRLGDDRLAVWLSESDPAAARQRAQRLIEAIRCHRFKWQQHSFPLSANVGLAPAGAGFDPLTSLLQNADAACLRAREQGANQIQVYQADDSSLTAQSKLLDWAGRIDALFADGRLFPRCQRIAPVGDPNQASHFEILLGVRDEAGRFVAPSELVAAAERWHRIEEIDRWQVDAAIGWIERWPQRFTAIGGLSINLSGQSLCSGTFLQFLETRLSGTGWPREQITFEITETAAIEGFDQAEKFIRRIRRYGCRFSLDDFGSGYSSYAYLKNLKVDFLKIDGAFVRELTDNAADYAMVKSMNEIAHSLGMKTIAEYAESAAILAVLQEIGVDYAQGYHIGKPLPLDDLRP